MKLKFLGAAITLTLLGTAQAQTANVTLYGRLDTALESIRISGATSGAASRSINLVSNDGSRWGLRGSEDLGGGLSAIFRLEGGFASDTGAITQGGVLFGRRAWVGLNSAALGSVTVGRNTEPMDDNSYLFDPFQTAGNAAQYQVVAYPTRINNSLKYITPTLGGFIGSVIYGLHEQPSGSPKIGEYFGASADFFNGPIGASLSYGEDKNTATSKRQRTFAGLSYNFGVVKPMAYYFQNTETGKAKRSAWSVGAVVPMGAGEFRASYTDLKQATAKANSLGLGYWYNMSKRTALYGSLAINKNNASSTLLTITPSFVGVTAGEDLRGLSFGMRHNF